jgi:hypothetical protein
MLYSYRTYRLLREADTSKLDALLNDPLFSSGGVSHEDADDFMQHIAGTEDEDPYGSLPDEGVLRAREERVAKIEADPVLAAALQRQGIDIKDPDEKEKLLDFMDEMGYELEDDIHQEMDSLGLTPGHGQDMLKYIVYRFTKWRKPTQAPAPAQSKAAQIRQQLMDEKNPTEDEAIEMLQQYIQKVNPPYHKDAMPQIPEISYMTGRFDSMLGHHNITRSNMIVKVDQIQPLQKDINYNQVKRMMTKGYKDKPLLVIDDGSGPYKLIDGHHKWAAIWCKMQMYPDMPDGKEWSQVPITVLKPPKNINTKQVLGILAEISHQIKTRQEAEGSLTLRKEMEARKDKIDAAAARFLSRFKSVGELGTEPEPAAAVQPPAATPSPSTAPPAKRGFAARASGLATRQQTPAVQPPPAAEPTPAPTPAATPAAPTKRGGFASRFTPKTESRRSWFFS